MTVEEIVKKFVELPDRMRNSISKSVKYYKCSKEDVIMAKRIARNMLRSGLDSTKTHEVPKILILDTETAPMQAYVWRLWKQDIQWDRVTSQWFMLCWSAKWLFSDKIYSDVVTPEEALKEDDSRIMGNLWKLLDEAQVVVAHNAKGADIPWINTRFIVNGFNPPKPYFIVDTLDIVRKQFAFSSNKLDALAEYLGIPHKLDTDFDLWRRCVNGDKDSLTYMLEYNKNDVKMLEEVYIKVAPWAKNLPNANNLLESDIPICASCGSEDIELIPNRWYYTSVGKYALYRCKKCGAISRGRYTVYEPKKIKLVGIAK